MIELFGVPPTLHYKRISIIHVASLITTQLQLVSIIFHKKKIFSERSGRKQKRRKKKAPFGDEPIYKISSNTSGLPRVSFRGSSEIIWGGQSDHYTGSQKILLDGRFGPPKNFPDDLFLRIILVDIVV